MKKVDAPKTNENVEHQNAIAIAKQIVELIGKDFFTIDQMRKKIIFTTPDKKGKRLSWAEARGYISSITSYGLVEESPAVKGFKIRLDHEFQLNYFDKQIDMKNEEIEVCKKIMQEIFDKDEVPELPIKSIKKTASKTKITKQK